MLGATRLRQLKVKKDSCKVRAVYRNEITECYAEDFSAGAEDKETFGEPQWTYSENRNGDSWWAPDDTTYPKVTDNFAINSLKG